MNILLVLIDEVIYLVSLSEGLTHVLVVDCLVLQDLVVHHATHLGFFYQLSLFEISILRWPFTKLYLFWLSSLIATW